MKKLFAMAAAAVLGMGSMAMAQDNPWHPAQTTVPINVNIAEMVELFTSTAPVALNIVDAGGNQGSTNAVSRTVTHLSNVDVTVSAEIDADIPVGTQFHILIKPTAGSWSTVGEAGAERILSWRRETSGYQGATNLGGATNNVNVNGPNTAAEAFDGLASASAVNVAVQYFAQSPNALPQDVGAQDPFNVVWTIAAQP